jgi:hypothetical protein
MIDGIAKGDGVPLNRAVVEGLGANDSYQAKGSPVGDIHPPPVPADVSGTAAAHATEISSLHDRFFIAAKSPIR